MDVLYANFYRFCWLLFPLIGLIFGACACHARNKERWRELLDELRAQLPEALRGTIPALELGELPTSEDVARWRQQLDQDVRTARDLEREASSNETALALKNVEREQARHNVAERARELSELERRLAAAQAGLNAQDKQVEKLNVVLGDKDQLLLELERKLAAAEAGAANEEQALSRVTASQRERNKDLTRAAADIEEARQTLVGREAEIARLRELAERERESAQQLSDRAASSDTRAEGLTADIEGAGGKRASVTEALNEVATLAAAAVQGASADRLRVEEAQRERDRLAAQLSAEKQAHGDLTNRLAPLSARRSKLEDLERESQSAAAAQAKQREDYVDQKSRLADALTESEARLAELQRERMALEKQVSLDKTRFESLEKEVSEARRQDEGQDERLGALQVRIDRAQRSERERVVQLEGELEELRAALAHRRESLEKLEGEEGGVTGSIQKQRKLKEAEGARLNEVRSEVEHKRLKLSTLRQQYVAREEELESYKRREETLLENERHADQKLGPIESTLVDRQQAFKKAQAALEVVNGELDETTEELKARRLLAKTREGELEESQTSGMQGGAE